VRILVTGATGFVGRYAVAAGLAAGHEIRAVVRPSSTDATLRAVPGAGRLDIARLDLRSPAGIAGALEGVETVVHLAAAKEGDFYSQFAGTVTATENLLTAMTGAGVERLVGVSTFSVYDYVNLPAGSLVTEDSPVDASPAKRDEYARTKLIQERLFTDFSDAGNPVVIVRPGMIYGRGNLWHALLGAEVGPRFLRVGSRAILPMAYVENVADGLIAAAAALGPDDSPVAGEVINIVDDHLPTQEAYVAAVTAMVDHPPTITVPWPVMRSLAAALQWGNDLLVGGRAKFPGIVVPERLHARFKPLRYANAKAKRLLDWSPRFSLDEAIARSVEPRCGEAPRSGDREVDAGG